MIVLSVALVAFLALELFNVLMLYLSPGTRRGNGIGVFNAYEKSKEDPEVHALVTYLINWVAGTKLIFSILTFFSRLYPSIKTMDEAGEITPKGYSRTLGVMIVSFVGVFAAAVVVFLVFFSGA